MASKQRGGEERPVLADVQPIAWSDGQAVSYEVAVEGINQVVGLYSGLIAIERGRDQPDAEAVAAWTAERARYSGLRRTLASQDADAVERVQHECAEMIRELRARL